MCKLIANSLPFINSSMALQIFVGSWPLHHFRNPFTQSVGLLGRVISPPQGRYLHTEHKHIINAHRNIHALSCIRTHNPRVRASEDGSCLRPRDHCDRQFTTLLIEILLMMIIMIIISIIIIIIIRSAGKLSYSQSRYEQVISRFYSQAALQHSGIVSAYK
jgi:hypothetical protein